MLDNRELASVIILASLLLSACLKSDLRSSIGRALAAIFAPKLCLLWAIYIASSVLPSTGC